MGNRRNRFGRQCLLARRLVESGVRFVEITSPVGWDHHFMIQDTLRESAEATDQPMAALLADLKQRDMLKDTLVIWAGEFGPHAVRSKRHGTRPQQQGLYDLDGGRRSQRWLSIWRY